jgi:hypothetical protein
MKKTELIQLITETINESHADTINNTTKLIEDGVDSKKIKKSDLRYIIDMNKELSDPTFNGFWDSLGSGWKQGIENKRVSEAQIASLQASFISVNRERIIATAYHNALLNHTNPELVTEVEELLNKL